MKLKGDGGVTPFINSDAFVSPPSFTYGNTPATGAYELRNRHFFNQDLNLSRNFQIRENLRFVFGADSFNLFNNVRLGSFNTNITNSNFGKLVSTDMARPAGAVERALTPVGATGTKLSALPEKAQRTIKAKAPETQITNISRQDKDGRVIYEIAFKDQGTMRVAEDGTLVQDLQK